MKKIAIAAFTAVVSLTPACGSWWTEFKNNPAQYVDAFITYVTTFIQTAEAVFNAAITLVPADQQAAVEQDFATGVAAVQHAVQALKDAENAAIAAEQPNPDFTALVNSVVDAITQVENIINEFKTGSPRIASARTPSGYEALSLAYAEIAKYKH